MGNNDHIPYHGTMGRHAAKIPSARSVDRPDPAVLLSIPPDTRTNTGRLLGDPIFERSALYQKMQEAGK